MTAACNCIAETNVMLREHNAVLITTMFRDPDVAVISTDKIDSKQRGKPPVMLASFCPFCGQKYAEVQP